MKKFWLKILLLFVPVFLVLMFPVWVLWQAGEITPIHKVIEIQDSKPNVLFAPGYNSFEKNYKFEQILRDPPTVLGLGNSRIISIRSEFFNPDVKFYNGGLLVKKIQHYRTILDQIPQDKQPKVIIMVVEQSQFNEKVNSFYGYDVVQELSEQRPMQYFLNAIIRNWVNVYRNYFAGKFTIKDTFHFKDNKDHIGMLALTQDEGFRADGSYRFGRFLLAPHNPNQFDYEFKDTLANMQNNIGYFRPNDQVSPRALAELDEFLQECKRRNIYVLGYIPPYAHLIYEKLKEDPKFKYLFEVEGKTRPIFDKYGFELYNFSDMASFGGKDPEAFDGVHVAEKAFARFFMVMAKKSPVLGKLTDPGRLQKLIDTAPDDYQIFPR